jgi:predicted metal-dependent HD superfamily phosphohydrolase
MPRHSRHDADVADGAAGLDAWAASVRAAGATAADVAVTAAGSELLARWHEPHRRYHDAVHLTEVLAAIDRLAGEARDLSAARLAAWFHDAVYDGVPGVDEEASAVLAERVLTGLGVPERRVAAIAALVRMTASHQPVGGDLDGDVLCDADLAILAAPAERYARYAAAVRAEYAAVPDAEFRTGRAAVLTALASRPHVYRTATGRALWESAARANLERELAALRPGRAAPGPGPGAPATPR